VLHGHCSFLPRFCNFIIKILQSEVLTVIDVKFRIFFPCANKDDLVWTAVIHCGQAHRARMCQNINFTSIKVLRLKNGRGLPYGKDFSMCCGVMSLRDLVCRFCNHLPVFRDHAGKRAPPLLLHFFLQAQ